MKWFTFFLLLPMLQVCSSLENSRRGFLLPAEKIELVKEVLCPEKALWRLVQDAMELIRTGPAGKQERRTVAVPVGDVKAAFTGLDKVLLLCEDYADNPREEGELKKTVTDEPLPEAVVELLRERVCLTEGLDDIIEEVTKKLMEKFKPDQPAKGKPKVPVPVIVALTTLSGIYKKVCYSQQEKEIVVPSQEVIEKKSDIKAEAETILCGDVVTELVKTLRPYIDPTVLMLKDKGDIVAEEAKRTSPERIIVHLIHDHDNICGDKSVREKISRILRMLEEEEVEDNYHKIIKRDASFDALQELPKEHLAELKGLVCVANVKTLFSDSDKIEKTGLPSLRALGILVKKLCTAEAEAQPEKRKMRVPLTDAQKAAIQEKLKVELCGDFITELVKKLQNIVPKEVDENAKRQKGKGGRRRPSAIHIIKSLIHAHKDVCETEETDESNTRALLLLRELEQIQIGRQKRAAEETGLSEEVLGQIKTLVCTDKTKTFFADLKETIKALKETPAPETRAIDESVKNKIPRPIIVLKFAKFARKLCEWGDGKEIPAAAGAANP